MTEREYFTWTEESTPDNNVPVLPIKEGHIPVYERVEDGDAKHVGWMTLDEYNKTEEELMKREEEVKHEMDCLGGTCTVTPLGYRLWHFFSPCVPCI